MDAERQTPSPTKPHRARAIQADRAALRVDVGLPVFNEERALRPSVEALHAHLVAHSFARWQIVIVDNGSTDATADIARALCDELEHVRYVQLSARGKGRALRELIRRSQSDVIAYMDIDLSTNLKYFNLLVEGVLCGYDICIGTRLMQGSRIRRSIEREIASRVFNGLVKAMFGSRFSDASCGFKSFRTAVAKALLDHVESDSWCFDVELLLVAERNALRVFEIPVEWIEGGQSKVDLLPTAAEYIRELTRIRATLHQKRL